MRTWLKSWPKRGSKKACTGEGNGWPTPCKALTCACTAGETAEVILWLGGSFLPPHTPLTSAACGHQVFAHLARIGLRCQGRACASPARLPDLLPAHTDLPAR